MACLAHSRLFNIQISYFCQFITGDDVVMITVCRAQWFMSALSFCARGKQKKFKYDRLLFQGGPYYDTLHSLLSAYVCYQPEIGYVQGMSFIAAVLLLNMEELDAFICFANMLNRPCHKAFYSLDVQKVKNWEYFARESINYVRTPSPVFSHPPPPLPFV